MSTVELLLLQRVWRDLPQADRTRLFDEFPEVYDAVEAWVRARQ